MPHRGSQQSKRMSPQRLASRKGYMRTDSSFPLSGAHKNTAYSCTHVQTPTALESTSNSHLIQQLILTGEFPQTNAI